MKAIGVLALQGAVTEHLVQLRRLGIDAVEIKHTAQLAHLSGLIIPGGESTAMSRLIAENHFAEPIRQFAAQGKGILGTCAGLILCGRQTSQSDSRDRPVMPLNLIDISVERNGFGRQIDSFEVVLDIPLIGQQIPAVFIRAPYITQLGNEVEVLARLDGRIVMARHINVLVAAFHPELTNDLRVMEYFINLCPELNQCIAQ